MRVTTMLKNTTAPYPGMPLNADEVSRMTSGLEQARAIVAERMHPTGTPMRLRSPWTGAFYWIEGEPDDWEGRLSQIATEDEARLELMQAQGGIQ